MMASALSHSAIEWKLGTAIPPAAVIASTVRCAGVLSAPPPHASLPRSFTRTLAPEAAASLAISAPTPLPAPVTTTTLPSSIFEAVIIPSPRSGRLQQPKITPRLYIHMVRFLTSSMRPSVKGRCSGKDFDDASVEHDDVALARKTAKTDGCGWRDRQSGRETGRDRVCQYV